MDAAELPLLDEIFNMLASGRHISTDAGEHYQALQKHHELFTALFQALGFRMVYDSRGFYYFEASENPSPQAQKMAIFVFILIEALADEAESIERSLFQQDWVIDELPHLRRERYRGFLKQLGVEPTVEDLSKIVIALDRFGFVARLDDRRFTFLTPAYRLLDICQEVAAAADREAESAAASSAEDGE